jgi:hypothetical protein
MQAVIAATIAATASLNYPIRSPRRLSRTGSCAAFSTITRHRSAACMSYTRAADTFRPWSRHSSRSQLSDGAPQEPARMMRPRPYRTRADELALNRSPHESWVTASGRILNPGLPTNSHFGAKRTLADAVAKSHRDPEPGGRPFHRRVALACCLSLRSWRLPGPKPPRLRLGRHGKAMTISFVVSLPPPKKAETEPERAATYCLPSSA